ncbi:hypothetical protein ACFL10_02370, partial [Patescibacteria group bacterium]
WGLTTSNIIVEINKTNDKIRIMHVDLRDQFEQFDPEVYKRGKGIAKHALHIIGTIAPFAILNNIAHFAEKAYQVNFKEVPRKDDEGPEGIKTTARSLVNQLFKDAKGYIEALIEQGDS